MKKKLLRDCLRRSLDGMSGHSQYRHYIHFSFAVVDNAVCVVGTNKSAVPALHFGYNARVPEPKVHSELDAYHKLRKKVSLAKTEWSLVNVRINRSGEWKVSKPCEVCQVWLKELGCSKVYYTTEAGWQSLSLS